MGKDDTHSVPATSFQLMKAQQRHYAAFSPPQTKMNVLTRVSILIYFCYVVSKVSAYPNPQAVPKLDSSQSPFAIFAPSSSLTQPGPSSTVQLAPNTLSTRYPTLSPTSESSPLIPASTLPSPSSLLLFSSFPSGDAVPARRSSLNPMVSIIPTLDPLDSSLGPNPTPVDMATAPLVPQPSEQAPFDPPPDYQTVSLSTEVPHSSSDAWSSSPEHSTTPMNNGFVIGVVFASMFILTIVCLLMLRCSRWYHANRSSVSSSSKLTQGGSYSNPGAMEKRRWMRGTLFDVETGMVENLAGIGRVVCEFISVRGVVLYVY